MQVAVVIPTTEKNKKLFEELVVSLSAQSLPPSRLIVIYDGELRPEKESFDNCPLAISWIENPGNVSLTRLLNQAVDISKCQAVLLLNDDIKLETGFIEELVLCLKLDKTIGMVCGKILRMDDPDLIDTTGLFLGRDRKPYERGYGRKDGGEFETPEYVFGACGAAVLYRKSMLKDTALSYGEYFDADYNMFYEDLDLSWRSRNFGWKAFYTNKAVAYHSRGATAKEIKPSWGFLEAYNFAWLNSRLKSDLIKNRFMTIIKNDSPLSFIINSPFVFAYDLRLFVYCLIFDPQVIVNVIRNFPLIAGALKKRGEIRKKIKAKKSGLVHGKDRRV